jgi:hypothetical protein
MPHKLSLGGYMENKKENEKKPYTAPTVTDHGKVVEQTKGIVSSYWEVFGHQGPHDVD